MFSKFLKHVVPGIIKPLHSLWNEIIGFVFLCFTGLAVFAVVRAIRSYDQTLDGVFRIVVPAGFALVMGYYCLSSFFRARKISRS
jgi:glycerol uptake facilitator-like aquaporin